MLAMHDIEPARGETEPLDLDAGDFRRFYEDALPRVYGYLLHRCGGSASVAEDLTQETFLAAVAELKKGSRRRCTRPVDLRDRAAQAARLLPSAGTARATPRRGSRARGGIGA